MSRGRYHRAPDGTFAPRSTPATLFSKQDCKPRPLVDEKYLHFDFHCSGGVGPTFTFTVNCRLVEGVIGSSIASANMLCRDQAQRIKVDSEKHTITWSELSEINDYFKGYIKTYMETWPACRTALSGFIEAYEAQSPMCIEPG